MNDHNWQVIEVNQWRTDTYTWAWRSDISPETVQKEAIKRAKKRSKAVAVVYLTMQLKGCADPIFFMNGKQVRQLPLPIPLVQLELF